MRIVKNYIVAEKKVATVARFSSQNFLPPKISAYKVNKRHTNNLYMRKCIHTIYFMIQKHVALSENYGDILTHCSI